MDRKQTKATVSDSKTSAPNFLPADIASFKANLLLIDRAVRETAAASESVKALKEELQRKEKHIEYLKEELRVLKDAEQKAREDSALLRSLTLEQTAKMAESSDKIVQLQMAEERWRTISEEHKKTIDGQRTEMLDLRSKYETLLRNEASLLAKYEILQAQLAEYKSSWWTKKASYLAQPSGNRYCRRSGDVYCNTVTCLSPAVSSSKYNEAASERRDLLPLEVDSKNDIDKWFLYNGSERPESPAIDDVYVTEKEISESLDDHSSSGFSATEPFTDEPIDLPCSKDYKNNKKRKYSLASVILRKVRVALALPPLLEPVRPLKERKTASSQPVRKTSKRKLEKHSQVGSSSLDLLPPPQKQLPSTDSLAQPVNKKEKASELVSIPQEPDKSESPESPTLTQLPAKRGIQLIPIESVGRRGKWRKDISLQSNQSERKIVGSSDGRVPLGTSERDGLSADEAPVAGPIITSSDLGAHAVCSSENMRSSVDDVVADKPKKNNEQKPSTSSYHSDYDVEDRSVICCDDPIVTITDKGPVQADSLRVIFPPDRDEPQPSISSCVFDYDVEDRLVICCDDPVVTVPDKDPAWAIRFPGPFPPDDHCHALPTSEPSAVSSKVERYLLGLFNVSGFLDPSLVCKRLDSLGETLTPQSLTSSIITVLVNRGFLSVNICRMARIIPFAPVKVKGERCIAALLEQLFQKRPPEWSSDVKNLLVKQLLSRLRLDDSLSAAQVETLCRFYALFAGKMNSTATVRRLIKSAAMLAVEKEAELALSVLISWPEAFKEILYDSEKQPFARALLTLLVKASKAMPQNALEKLISKLCNEEISIPTVNHKELCLDLSRMLLNHSELEVSDDTGDVRLTMEWARKLYMMEVLFKVANDTDMVSVVRDNFFIDVITWPNGSTARVEESRFRSVLVSLIVLAQIADTTPAFSQIDLSQIMCKLEEILLEGEGPHAEKSILRSCCAQLLVRILPLYPRRCYRMLENECNASTSGACWRRHFEIAKQVYLHSRKNI